MNIFFKKQKMIFPSVLLLLSLSSLSFAQNDWPNFDKVSCEAEASSRFKDLDHYFKTSYKDTHKAYFNRVYISVTDGLIERGTDFCLNQMIIEFANKYLFALKQEQLNKTVPAVWKEMFEFDGSPTMYLLLGMNAHISYDLPLSLYKVSKTYPTRCSSNQIHDQYFELNEFFRGITPRLNQDIKNVYSELKMTSNIPKDKINDHIEEKVIFRLVKNLRQRAWNSYLRLMNASDLEFEKVQLKQRALFLSNFFKQFGPVVPEVGY